MPNFKKAKYIFDKLKIKNPLETVFYNMNNFDEKLFHKIFSGEMKQDGGGNIGGNYDEDIYIEYKKEKYLFSRFKEDDYIFYALHQNEDIGEPMCIMIIIEKDEKNCSIQTISYNDKCFAKKNIFKLEKTKGGDLLKLALKLIDMIKNKYKIKTITLTDNAQKKCGDKKKINLSMMMTLMTGDTWYGKYGFIPKEKKMIERYEKNKDIINNTRIESVLFFKEMMDNAVNKYYKDNKKMIKAVMNTLEEYYIHNKKLSSFLQYLLGYYDVTCEMFYEFYEDLYQQLGLYNFYAKNFIKKI
jgi:hypothetical protein